MNFLCCYKYNYVIFRFIYIDVLYPKNAFGYKT